MVVFPYFQRHISEMGIRFLSLSTVLLSVVVSSVWGAPDILRVNPSTHKIVDSAGRERLFHGVNVVVKGPPWIPQTEQFDPHWSFCEDDMKLLQSWGMNFIRLGMMWPGVEPVKGQYNDTYLKLSRDIINKAAEYGIYTLLDMHQDCFSEKFCGEGVPDWAVDSGNAKDFPYPIGPPFTYDPNTGYPTKEDCAKHPWSSYQLSRAGAAAYQALYNNSNGLAIQMAQFWGRVAQEFADNENVIGYELINEPFAGDVYANPELLLPTVADKANLEPFYDIINTEIRKYDDKHSVYFTSITWDEWGVGFNKVPGGEQYQNRTVLSWHFYVPPQIFDSLSFLERQKDIERLGCAGFLTEFQIGDKKTIQEADKYLLSWATWDYKAYVEITGSSSGFWTKNGTLNSDLVKTMSRSYAQAVAGVTTEMNFNPDNLNFFLKYTTTNDCSSNLTEIYINEGLHYQNGYSVILETNNNVAKGVKWFSPQKNVIHIQHDLTLPEHTGITVIVNPK